jgi:hypothetical protein
MMSDPRFNVSALVFGQPMIGEIVQRLVFPAGRDKRKDHPCARGARGMGQRAAKPKNPSLSPSALVAGFAHWIC